MLKEDKMKIFCIGYNKTGTTSLYHSITKLGFNGDVNTFVEGELQLKNIIKGNTKQVLHWVSGLNEIEVFKDIPFSLPNFWKLLYEKYPNAIYVLSERDSSEQWYNSISNFHRIGFKLSKEPTWEEVSKIGYSYINLPERIIEFIPAHPIPSGTLCGMISDYLKYTFGEEHLPYDKENMIRSYELHNKEVKEFFKNKDNFISVNVSNDSDYLKLCNYLNVEPKSNKFLEHYVNKRLKKHIIINS